MKLVIKRAKTVGELFPMNSNYVAFSCPTNLQHAANSRCGAPWDNDCMTCEGLLLGADGPQPVHFFLKIIDLTDRAITLLRRRRLALSEHSLVRKHPAQSHKTQRCSQTTSEKNTHSRSKGHPATQHNTTPHTRQPAFPSCSHVSCVCPRRLKSGMGFHKAT